MRVYFLSLLISISAYSQSNLLKTAEKIKLFADYLFCEHDYLRAAEEYISLGDSSLTDTIIYKIAKCFSFIEESQKSLEYFHRISSSSLLFDDAIRETGKIYYMLKDTLSLNKLISQTNNSFSELTKLKIALKLERNQIEDITRFFSDSDEDFNVFYEFYQKRLNPDYKSESIAGILSAIIPGSGKIYTKEYGDGITAFVLTGLFSYLAYDNFKKDHNFRGYLFTSIAVGFYLGNIYGSVASAQIFNAKVNFSFIEDLAEFLNQRNYFTKEYDFCK